MLVKKLSTQISQVSMILIIWKMRSASLLYRLVRYSSWITDMNYKKRDILQNDIRMDFGQNEFCAVRHPHPWLFLSTSSILMFLKMALSLKRTGSWSLRCLLRKSNLQTSPPTSDNELSTVQVKTEPSRIMDTAKVVKTVREWILRNPKQNLAAMACETMKRTMPSDMIQNFRLTLGAKLSC